jgi:hypothetical protein
MEQYFGAVPPAGEHTVLNAFAVGRTDERLKTFLIPFGVYQKEFACRGETRPGGRAGTFEEITRNGTPPRDDETADHWKCHQLFVSAN